MYLFYPLLGCCCLPISFPSIYSYLLVFFFFFFPFPCPFSPPFHYEIYGYVSKSMCSWITSLTHCLTEKTRLAEKGNTI